MHHGRFVAGRGDAGARFSREIGVDTDSRGRLRRGVELVAALVPGAEDVSVTTVARRAVLQTTATTSRLASRADRWQQQFGEGPSVETITTHANVISRDLASEERWPRWSRAAVDDLGLGSVLVVLLFTDERELGSLNLYAHRRDAFDGEDRARTESLAAHLALATEDAREIEQRAAGMETRTIIGQAEGILMERYRLDADRAFTILRRLSQDNNRKLIDIARELVATGRLPDGRPDR